jgi:ABC-2 type transport system ATP-binding protein
VEILRHQLRLYRPDSIPRSHYSAAIENKLKEVGLWSHRQKKVKQMSKGMGRRVAWAQATIHEPDLLILDEPFSGMDPLGRQLMSELITQYKTKQKTIILCTHELGTVNEVCDHLHILNQGKLVYSSVNDTEGPRHAGYQLNLSGCTVQDLSSRKDQVGVEGWDWHEESGYAVKLWFREYRQAAQWLEFCLREGLIVTSFHKTRGFQEDELLRYFTGDKSA